MTKFYIVQTVFPEPHGYTKDFRIVERQQTCDGTRDRLTSRCFHTLEEAIHEINTLRIL